MRRGLLLCALMLSALDLAAQEQPFATTSFSKTSPLSGEVIQFLDLKDATVKVAPDPLTRGELATVTIEIPNPTAAEWEITTRATVGIAALFHSATDTPAVSKRGVDSFLGLSWPSRVLPARSRKTISFDVVLREEEAGPLVLRVDVDARDRQRHVASRTFEFQIEATWGESQRGGWAGCGPFIIGGVLLSLVAAPTVLLFWRAARTASPQATTALRISAIVVVIGSLMASFAVAMETWTSWSTGKDYVETTCRVTDSMLVDRGSSSKSHRRWYATLFAVDVQKDNRAIPVIIGDGDLRTRGLLRIEDASARVNKFRVGGSYPCWHSQKNRHDATFEADAPSTPYFFLGALLLLLAAPGFVSMIFRRLNSSSPQ